MVRFFINTICLSISNFFFFLIEMPFLLSISIIEKSYLLFKFYLKHYFFSEAITYPKTQSSILRNPVKSLPP